MQNIFEVALSTVGSRVLGLLRDIGLAVWLGVSAAGNAFIFAFNVPNLFRRLLGEGALASALVPVLTSEQQAHGREAMFRLLNQALSRALLALLGVALLGAGVYLWLGLWTGPSGAWRNAPLAAQWQLGAWLGLALMPYVIFVCLAALLGAALNVLGYFRHPALAPIWLNCAMLAALGLAGGLWQAPPETVALVLVPGVLLGGAAQLLGPAWGLWQQGWRPRWIWGQSAALAELWRLFLPGVFAAAIGQINSMVVRVAAFALSASAVTTLYLANRLVELPLGVFVVSVITVWFPRLSAVAGDSQAFAEARAQGNRLVQAISWPAALGLLLLAEPIVAVLYGWGRFDAEAVAGTALILRILALSLPALAWTALETRTCHARRDMRTPLRWAVVALLLNLGLAVALAPAFEGPGLALANLVSAWAQALGLSASQRHQFNATPTTHAARAILCATLAMTAIVAGLTFALNQLPLPPSTAQWLQVVLLVPAGIAAYAGALRQAKFAEWQALCQSLPLRRLGR